MKSLTATSGVSLVLIVLFLFAPDGNSGPTVPAAQVAYTFQAPVIHGNKDLVWLSAVSSGQNNTLKNN